VLTNKLSKTPLGSPLAIGQTLAILLISGSPWALTSHADQLDEIQRARETAEMQYVNEVATGKYKTTDEREALRKRILEPSEQKAHDYFKSVSTLPKAKPVKAEDIDLSQAPKQDLTSVANEAHDSNSAQGRPAAITAGVPTSEKAPLRPEFVLDGSNVPREITFPQTKKPDSK
jgi:hypothetical protein